MGLSETAELGVKLALDDELSKPMNSAAEEVKSFEKATDGAAAAVTHADTATAGFAERLEGARPKIREFSRAGSELSLVASVLGTDLQATLGPLGEFIHILGDAGLLATAVADIGPAVTRAAASALGLATSSTAAAAAISETGAAAAAATPAVEGLAAAEGTAAAAGVAAAGGVAGLGGALATLGPVALAVGGGLLAVKTAQDNMARSLDEASIIQNRQLNQIAESLPVYDALGNVISGAAQQTSHWHDLMDGATTAENTLALKTHELYDAATLLGTTALPEVVSAVANAQSGSGALTAAFQDLKGQTDTNAQSVTDLSTALDDLPRDITINVVTKFSDTGAGALSVGLPGGTGVQAVNNDSTDLARRQQEIADAAARAAQAARDKAQREAEAAANKAASEAKQRADELARIYNTNVTDAFNAARQAGDAFLDSQHQKAQQAINDALTLAQTNHDAAIQRINDTLNAQLVSDRTPVTDAQNALSGTQNREQLRNLKEAADSAFTALQQNTSQDPATVERLQRALRDAREAVQNFQAQLHINDLSGQQAVKDKAARDTAQKSIEDADLAYQTAKAKHDKDLAQEALEAAAKLRAFDNDVAGLEAAFLSHKSKLSTALDSITKLFQAFAIDNKPPPTGGYKAPAVTVNITPTFRLTLNGRDVASALATVNNPTQSGSVRSGSNQ